jgi:hypothetical protein
MSESKQSTMLEIFLPLASSIPVVLKYMCGIWRTSSCRGFFSCLLSWQSCQHSPIICLMVWYTTHLSRYKLNSTVAQPCQLLHLLWVWFLHSILFCLGIILAQPLHSDLSKTWEQLPIVGISFLISVLHAVYTNGSFIKVWLVVASVKTILPYCLNSSKVFIWPNSVPYTELFYSLPTHMQPCGWPGCLLHSP